MGITRGLITLVLLIAFHALVAWLYSSRNKHRFDAVARLPLENDLGTEPLSPTSAAQDVRMARSAWMRGSGPTTGEEVKTSARND